MGHTLLCMLGYFSLNIFIYYGFAQDPVLTIEPNWSTLFTGESVTLICDMREGEDVDWYYAIYQGQRAITRINTNKKNTLGPLDTSYSGEYYCIGHHVRSRYTTKESNSVSLTVSGNDVILETPASVLYEGEWVTVRCRHRTQRNEENASFYKDGSLIETDTKQHSAVTSRNTVTVQLRSDRSSYTCEFDDDKSEPVKLKLEPQRPKATLRKHIGPVQVGGNVTLTCSMIGPSYGWTFFWYRGKKNSEPLTSRDAVFLSNDQISVSRGGLYWCRGGRGSPVYYTEYSSLVVTNRAVVTPQTSWAEIYYGQAITLTCEIVDGGDTEWEYNWALPRTYAPPKQKEYVISYVSSSDNGDYSCQGHVKQEAASTEWSDAFTLTVSDRPRPVLTVSPSWLSPGASVTLKCEIEHPSAGWSFYWYKAVPQLSNNYDYRSELLPDSSSGTEQDSYIVHGQTHTAGYVCRAGRGDPVYYTEYSVPKFVWSGDLHSAASLTVSPNRIQHFTQTSVKLTCEGNSTEWRVRRFSVFGYLTQCSSSSWGTMTRTTCSIHKSVDGLYWCESEMGQFSNAVNLTGGSDIILESPVHPVDVRASVTLGCKLKTENVPSEVDFYKNDKLIQNGSKWELTIPAVSKSDEGFYECKVKHLNGWQSWTSPKSWMSVKSVSGPQSSPFPVLVTVGLICGVLLIIPMLVFLYRCTKLKESCFTRSHGTNQCSATDHMINQDDHEGKDYVLPLPGEASLYETIKDGAEAGHDKSSEVMYSLIEHKNTNKNRTNNDPEESTVYSNLNMGSAGGHYLMYVQVRLHNKAKKDKGESNSTAAVYSEVKPGNSSW